MSMREIRQQYAARRPNKKPAAFVSARQKREKDPELLKVWRANRRLSYVKSKYGITLAEYHAMRDRQQNRCLTCNRHESEFKRRLHVDHDHATGKIRGLLCHHCNSLLGLAKDNPHTLRMCALYLEIHALTKGSA